MVKRQVKIEAIYTSPGHNYFGNRFPQPGVHPTISRHKVDLVADKGIMGDRFFDVKKNYNAQVTFFSIEVFEELCREMKVNDRSPGVFRRNIITRGIDLKSLIGQNFRLGGIDFYGVKHCAPCKWMNIAFAPGSLQALRGRGGLRAQVRSSGTLTPGDKEFVASVKADSGITMPLPRLHLP